MAGVNRRNVYTAAGVALLIAAAVACRFANRFVQIPATPVFGYLRSVIYIGLFAAWGISIRRRIIHPQVRRYLTAVSVLTVFWLTVRTIKYLFVAEPNTDRHLWYLFYVGMLLIPLMALFVSLSLGKAENYRLPKWTKLLYLPTLALLVLVLTNDLHQLVFGFPAGAAVFTGSDYCYAALYWPVIGWEIGCALSALALVLHKCRMPDGRGMLYLPIVPLLLSIAYGLLYVSGVGWLRVIAGDITVFQCLLYTAVLESCIQCGLIQSNTNYAELFRISTLGAQITDDAFNVCYSAENMRLVGKAVLESAASAPVVLQGGVRLSSAPIRGGYVFWQEDIADLLDTIEQLFGTREELQSYGSLLMEENKKKARAQKLAEQKRLYAAVQQTTARHAALMEGLGIQLERTEDIGVARTLLAQILVVGAYIKRRSNLIFLADAADAVPANELLLCLNESLANLRLLGIKCACTLDVSGSVDAGCAAAVFDFYETAVEQAFHTLRALTILVRRTSGQCAVFLMMDCEEDMADAVKAHFPDAEITRQDGVWFCSLSVAEERVCSK